MPRMGLATSRHVDRLAGNLLRLARVSKGLSQRELACIAEVAQSTIARIESGARQPSLPVLARIFAAVDLEMRIELAPFDNHDDVLDATEARLTSTERARRCAKQDSFITALRHGADLEART